MFLELTFGERCISRKARAFLGCAAFAARDDTVGKSARPDAVPSD
jgi:hypothetical protein